MARKGTGEYPTGWPEFARTLKEAAGWKCVRCDHPHDPKGGYCLTVHHLTMAKDEPFDHWWAFAVLCQRCHLQVQARVDLDRPWVMQDHTPWMQPLVGGYYAHKYLDLAVSRTEVEAQLPFFVSIEQRLLVGNLTKAALIELWRFLCRSRDTLDQIEQG